MNGVSEPTGHVFRVDRAKGPVWHAKYRLPNGRQVQKRLGPAWTDRGRPAAAGYFTKRTAAAWMRETLVEARRGTLPGSVRTGATFAGAAAEWLRFIAEDRERKPAMLRATAPPSRSTCCRPSEIGLSGRSRRTTSRRGGGLWQAGWDQPQDREPLAVRAGNPQLRWGGRYVSAGEARRA